MYCKRTICVRRQKSHLENRQSCHVLRGEADKSCHNRKQIGCQKLKSTEHEKAGWDVIVAWTTTSSRGTQRDVCGAPWTLASLSTAHVDNYCACWLMTPESVTCGILWPHACRKKKHPVISLLMPRETKPRVFFFLLYLSNSNGNANWCASIVKLLSFTAALEVSSVCYNGSSNHSSLVTLSRFQ